MSGWNSNGFTVATLQDVVPCGTFDGTDDSVELTVAVPAYPFTIACRFYLDSAGSGIDSVLTVCDASNTAQYVGLQYDTSTSQLEVLRRAGGASEAVDVGSPSEDAWHICIVEFESATAFDVWLDGVKTAYTGQTSLTPTGLDALMMGKLRVITPVQYFDGRLADVQFSGVVSDAEAVAFPSLPASAIAAYPISEGLGPTVHDTVGTADGTIGATESEFWANTRINR